MEYNFRIRVVISGRDSDKLSEEELIQFLKAELTSGTYGLDNPLIDEDMDCDMSYVEID